MSEAETADRSPDPQTAEVLRALQRARGMVARGELPPNGGPASRQVEESLLLSTRALEKALAIAIEQLADIPRGQDRAVRELRESARRFEEEANAVAAWWAWAARRVAAWGLILGLLTAAAAALSWRAHAVAATTQAILEQILENQARAQAAKSGNRR